jgi:methyl-accepting chemotaxis protein
MPEIAERLARFQTGQVENNPIWFAKYEEYCGTKGVEATRASPGYAQLFQTIRELFFALLDPSRPLEDVAKRMAETHQRIGVRLAWLLMACQNIEDEMRRLGLDHIFVTRMRTFTAQAAECYEQIFESIRTEALNNAEKVTHLLHESLGVANSVSQSAQELSDGQRELAKRVEHDAASVEEISAALEELNTSFQIMVKNARDTLKTTKDMTQAVDSLQTVMGHVVDLMNNISNQAHRTQTILNTITEVAFQTNILALNASVEAARLGNLGGGFSVIAKEIRRLSDKVSAEASSIGEWIGEMLSDVQKGQTSAIKAADDLDKLSDFSSQVSERMADTNSAIHDTETGFSQVQEAISNIDQGLQRTAAMVEEISAASDALLMQAQHLMQIRHQDKDKTQEVGPVKLGSQKPEQPRIRSITSTKQQPSSGDWETF